VCVAVRRCVCVLVCMRDCVCIREGGGRGGETERQGETETHTHAHTHTPKVSTIKTYPRRPRKAGKCHGVCPLYLSFFLSIFLGWRRPNFELNHWNRRVVSIRLMDPEESVPTEADILRPGIFIQNLNWSRGRGHGLCVWR